MTRARVGVLISGRGSNMEALARAAAAPDYPAELALVVANRPQAAGLARARELGLATAEIVSASFPGREAFERAVDAALREAAIDIVALAGFMRVLSPWFVAAWRDRLINIHPSLLPAFRGLATHVRAIEAGATLHGCTVHHVTEGVDEGPIIGQAAIAVGAADTPDTLAARVLAAEHLLYPRCLAAAARGGSLGAVAEVVGLGGETILISAPPLRALD
jgi:phosphoribosylglycinamide formyltransferase-1